MTNKIVDYKTPFFLFDEWLKKAKADQNIKEPEAMALATIDQNNKPSVRMVLLKKFSEEGFCFFTNLISRKAKELMNNSNAALCFYWMSLGYQVRIEGQVEQVLQSEADAYFSSRRRGSQIGAWASRQSQEIENEGEFEERIKKINQDFEGAEILRPPFWSGFRLRPSIIEFWEEGEFRLHKRTLYKKLENNNGWKVSILYP